MTYFHSDFDELALKESDIYPVLERAGIRFTGTSQAEAGGSWKKALSSRNTFSLDEICLILMGVAPEEERANYIDERNNSEFDRYWRLLMDAIYYGELDGKMLDTDQATYNARLWSGDVARWCKNAGLDWPFEARGEVGDQAGSADADELKTLRQQLEKKKNEMRGMHADIALLELQAAELTAFREHHVQRVRDLEVENTRLKEMVGGLGQPEDEIKQLRQHIAELEVRNAELDEEAERPATSALMLIARAMQLYQKDRSSRNQASFVLDVRQGHERLRGMSERTLNGLLSDAKKVFDEAKKKS